MLRNALLLLVVAVAWGGSIHTAAAHERWYEFEGTHVALSIERFMGLDYTDFEGPGRSDFSGRIMLNADEPVPTSLGRFGVDIFIRRLSIGIAGGVTSEDTGILAPRVGYLFGITPTIGIWLRGGAFYAATRGPNYFGIYGEALFAWFPIPQFALHLGPTLDVAFANDPNPNYVSIGLPQFGLSAFL